MKQIVFSDEAEEDLARGFEFYEGQLPGLGNRFRQSVFQDIDRLAMFAGIHSKWFGYHRLICRRFPYVVFYDVNEEVVSIVAIFDSRNDPGWISSRLR